MYQMIEALHYTTEIFCDYAQLYAIMTEQGVGQQTIDTLLASLEFYTQEQRLEILEALWGGVGNGTPAQAEAVTVPAPVAIRASGVISFYGVPRTALHLFHHAYLLKVTGKPEHWERMEKIIEELDPR
jgi:hypothetical protein